MKDPRKTNSLVSEERKKEILELIRKTPEALQGIERAKWEYYFKMRKLKS